MSGPKNIAFMRLPETEKMGLQHPDHQFKSGCRLLGIIERWFLFLCEKPSIYAASRDRKDGSAIFF